MYPTPSGLPIDAALPSLRAALREHRNAVLEAPPGAGKSTVVPLALLDEPWLGGRRIVMLQPRRIAARAVARRLAQLANEPDVGRLVGYRTRLESRVGPATRIEVVTEGILTRWLQDDPALEQVGAVLFDEFHERNLQSDLGLALALDAQRHLREELRLLVMSATLAGDAVASLLGPGTPIVRTAGRMHEVVTHYAAETAGARATNRPEPVDRRAARVALQALHVDTGDVLVFLPGAAEVRRACEAIAAEADDRTLQVLPLYGDLDAAAQDAALRPARAGERKVVVATNLAETSLTIEGVRIVVDAGLERRPRFDPVTGMSRLETVRISRASAEQRRGRAGRTAPGVCYRLWPESVQRSLQDHAPAEIVEADLAPLALELACWGNSDASTLAWLDPPPSATLGQARALLRDLEALDARGQVTATGRRMVQFGTHPRLAHMIERAAPLGCFDLACEIAALLSERDPLRTVAGQREPDLRLRLDALHGKHAPGDATRVDPRALQQIQRSAELLRRRAAARPVRKRQGEAHDPPATDAAPIDPDDAAGLLLAFAYPDRIGMARTGEEGRYLLSLGRGAVLSGPSALARSKFIVAAALDAGEREAQVRLAAPLRRDLLEQHFASVIEQRDEVGWDPRSGQVIRRRVKKLGEIVLEERPLDGDRATLGVERAMLEGVRVLGLDALPWTPALRQWQARVLLLRAHETTAANPSSRWPDVSDASLLESLDDWLEPYLAGMTRREHLARVDLAAALHGLLDWNQRRQLDELAPTHVAVPSGSRIPIDYTQASPTLSVRLQEVFGWSASPRIAAGRVPLTLELLSPARRPVQVTRDLASFWARGYADVRKELRGRYPKHYWPDDPLTAVATRKVRPPQHE